MIWTILARGVHRPRLRRGDLSMSGILLRDAPGGSNRRDRVSRTLGSLPFVKKR